MKNYLELTTVETIQRFLLSNPTVSPLPGQQLLQDQTQGLEEQPEQICISIIVPTHRIAPDWQVDVIQLKDLVTEAERALQAKGIPKRLLGDIMDNVRLAQEAFDPRHSLDTLVLYATKDFSTTAKLPVESSPEVIVGTHFDVRPLLRTQQQTRRYYVAVISRNKIRLMEGVDDRLYLELEDENFPYENDTYYTTDAEKLAQDDFEQNLVKEYFNVADKRLQIYLTHNPLPVVLAGDVKSVAYFREQMDDDRLVIGQIGGNYDNHKAQEVIDAVAPVVARFRQERQQLYLQQIDRASSARLTETNVDKIEESLRMQNVDTLYIGDEYILHGQVAEGGKFLRSTRSAEGAVVDDLLSPMIEEVYRAGGKAILMSDDLLEPYGGRVLVKRYDLASEQDAFDNPDNPE